MFGYDETQSVSAGQSEAQSTLSHMLEDTAAGRHLDDKKRIMAQKRERQVTTVGERSKKEHDQEAKEEILRGKHTMRKAPTVEMSLETHPVFALMLVELKHDVIISKRGPLWSPSHIFLPHPPPLGGPSFSPPFLSSSQPKLIIIPLLLRHFSFASHLSRHV